jgi:phospholipase C
VAAPRASYPSEPVELERVTLWHQAMSGLSSIELIVVLMLENRSMDHMLGYLYAAQDNLSPTRSAIRGPHPGRESNPDASGKPVTVSAIDQTTPNAYLMPGADPGEGYMANEPSAGRSA